MTPKNRLGIFVRVPVAGHVKTRLVPPLSAETACDLYRAFLGDLFERLGGVKAVVSVFYSGEPAETMQPLLPRPWPLVAQSGSTLGERMAAAFNHLLAGGASRAVVIGSDSPDLPMAYLRRAFGLLKHRDVVLGPALDGGYYLIGLRRPAPALFSGIEWGTPAVLPATLEHIAREGLTLSLLPPWYDVDDMQTLELLRNLCAARRPAGGVRLPRTEAVLAQWGDVGAGGW